MTTLVRWLSSAIVSAESDERVDTSHPSMTPCGPSNMIGLRAITPGVIGTVDSATKTHPLRIDEREVLAHNRIDAIAVLQNNGDPRPGCSQCCRNVGQAD